MNFKYNCFICETEFSCFYCLENYFRSISICAGCTAFMNTVLELSFSNEALEKYSRYGGSEWTNTDLPKRAKLIYKNKDNKCSVCKIPTPHSTNIECIKCSIDKLLS
jgi:hypothetical protein